MGNSIDIFPEPTAMGAESWKRSCRLVERVDGSESEKQLWWEYPSNVPQATQKNCDSYLLAVLLPAMKQGADIHVHGSVCSELLANMTELQRVWVKWCPEVYQEVKIEVDEVRDEGEPVAGAVVTFSGGVDGQFTTYRHTKGLARDKRISISAGVLVHGFDIPLEDHDGIAGAAERARVALADLELNLILVRTNITEVSLVNWEHYCGTALASVFSGMADFAGMALIASGDAYDRLVVPWGSHPITDPLLSSKRMQVIHDGAGYSRFEKIKVLSAWEVGVRNLRVCWAGELHDRNCGNCEKCVRTRLDFLLAGEPDPTCFDTPLGKKSLASVVLRSEAERLDWKFFYDKIIRTGIGKDMLPEIEKVLKRPSVRWGSILPANTRRRLIAKRFLGK
ncbi:hypothetical protein [Billgrantia montanilacus]|uniref:hypothetical protein n=1 Tax=Billgrantia montanilacus TaxID=2282305 RepID=UPI0011C04DBE|nr:hypothetical protein [Halomonas montanilacus]